MKQAAIAAQAIEKTTEVAVEAFDMLTNAKHQQWNFMRMRVVVLMQRNSARSVICHAI